MKKEYFSNKTITPDFLVKQAKETLFQYFYLFGIEPDSIDISDFNPDKLFLEKNFKKAQVLNQFPPYKRIQSYIDPNIVLNHCFPKGYKILISDKQPKDAFFFFSLDNLNKYSQQNKRIYFTTAIIFEPVKSYLEIKYKNKIPPIPKIVIKEDKNGKEKEVLLDNIYFQKALCFSSLVPFPYEIKNLLMELLEYSRKNEITNPMEKLIETIIFGIPLPRRAYFNISCKKTSELIPKQKKEIDFCLKPFNKYNLYSYSYQNILGFPIKDMLIIFKSLLLEVPILFFGTIKEVLTNIVETFISLLYPLEYQYPYISILPDAYCSLIEREKNFVFGINHRLIWEGKDKNKHPTYFRNMHLNVHNKFFLICDTDTNSIYHYYYHDKLYHMVNFNDLGVYPETKDGDTSQCVSKDINSDIFQNIIEINLPEKITNKIIKDLNNYLNKNYEFIRDNHDYSEEINTKIAENFFYDYMINLLNNYYSYLYNDEENIKNKIGYEILNKREEDIEIENLFLVNKFLDDNNKHDTVFYAKFFKTRMFKNFIIRKYLNDPWDRYNFLHFDEKMLEKKSKGFFSKKIKTEYISNHKIFDFKTIYIISKSNNYFTESEINYMKSHKDILINKYSQNFGQYNKIKYIVFPRLIYDNKFFGENEYKSNTEFSGNFIGCLRGYQAIEEALINEINPYSFFNIYIKTPMNKYIVDIDKIDVKNEVSNSLNKVWVYVFCLTFHYCDDIEKNFRFEELMQFLPRIVDEKKELIPILLTTIKEYGTENMMIKIFESIKNVSYFEFCYFCSKFENNSKIKWKLKKIDTTNSRLNIQYYREIKKEENRLEEVKNCDYDIKLLKKKTFGSKNNKEKIYFDLFYQCQNCRDCSEITNLTINLSDKLRSNLMICEKCKNVLKPKTYVSNGGEKIDFTINSPIDLLTSARAIMTEYGPKIDIDKLRSDYTDFYWNCILYFYLSGLSFEMLLKYKEKDSTEKNNQKNEKRKGKKFMKLQIQRQQVDV